MSRLSNRFHEAVAKIAESKPDLMLQQAKQLSNTAFSVTASHAPYREELTRADYENMVLSATNNQFRFVSDTLVKLRSTSSDVVVSGIIEANTMTKEYDETDVRNNMRVITANVFADNEDKIWRVVESGGVKHLVQSISEDFAQLIKSRLARRSNEIVSSAVYNGIVPADGDYVMFYDTNNSAINYGFAMTVAGDLHVGSRHSNDFTKIDSSQVIMAADGDSLDRKHSLNHMMKAATPNESDFNSDTEGYLNYMRQLFAGTDYFQGLEKLLSNRRRLGQSNVPLSLINY